MAELEVPTLREWPTKEREALIEHLVKRQQKSLQKAQPLRLTAATLKLLLDHPFLGNVRELENLLTKLYIFAPADNPEVRPQDLPARYRQTGAANTSTSLLMRDAERAHAVRVLNLYGGVKAKAAKALGMDVRTLTSTLLD